MKEINFGGVGQNGVSIGADEEGDMLLLVTTGDSAIVTALGLSEVRIGERTITKEVPVEVVKEVLSPISFLVLGVSVIAIAIGGILLRLKRR